MTRIRPGGTSAAALSTTLARSVDPVRNRTATKPPRILTLVGGQDDESPTGTNCTISADTVNYKLGTRGHKMTMTAAVTAQLRMDPPSTVADPLTFPYGSAVGLWIYLEDHTKVSYVEADLYSVDPPTTGWIRTSAQQSEPLKTGWNFFRWSAVSGGLSNWGTVYRTRIVVATTAATTATVGHLFVEMPEKAQLLFIADHAAATFYTDLYPDMKRLGVPVEFGVRPQRVGNVDGYTMSLAQLAEAADDGNGNAIGFHSYNGDAMTAMSAAQVREDTLKSMKWLASNGFDKPIWRTAFTQNDAPQHAAAQPFLTGYGTATAASAVHCWPPADTAGRWGIPRLALQGKTTTEVDAIFDTLEQTHGLAVIYTHGHDEAGGIHATQAEWDHFIGKIETAIDADWLEGVTYEDLFMRSGGRVEQSLGDARVVYRLSDGTETTQRLP